MTLATFDAPLERRSNHPSWTVRLIAATVAAFLLWAAFAWVEEIVRAPGQIVPSSRPQIIQNLEGGILAELNVAEGDTEYASHAGAQTANRASHVAPVQRARLLGNGFNGEISGAIEPVTIAQRGA